VADRAAQVRAGGTAIIADEVVARWFTPAYRQRRRFLYVTTNAFLISEGTLGVTSITEFTMALPYWHRRPLVRHRSGIRPSRRHPRRRPRFPRPRGAAQVRLASPHRQRPPRLGAGRLGAFTLKKPFADGTWAIDLDPLSLMFRLAALVPPAFQHQILRYLGVLSAHAAWRPFIVRHLPPLMAHRHRLPPRNPSLQATVVAIAHGLSFSVAVSPSTY
jgi:hypothetical protein